jgi:hypothetical protein
VCRGDRARGITAAILVAAALIVEPHTFRLAVSTPAFVDQTALAFGLAWLLLCGSEDRRLRLWAAPVGFVASVSREEWIVLLLIAAVLMAVRYRDRRAALAQLLAAGLASLVVLTRTSDGVNYSHPLTTLREHLASFGAVDRITWGYVFTIGLIPIAAVIAALHLRRRTFDEWTPVHELALVSGIVLIGLAAFGGIDLTRISYPGAVILVALAMGVIVRLPVTAAFYVLASAVLWRAWQAVQSPPDSYGDLYYPYEHPGLSLLLALLLLVLGGAVAFAESHIRTSHPRSGVNDGGYPHWLTPERGVGSQAAGSLS